MKRLLLTITLAALIAAGCGPTSKTASKTDSSGGNTVTTGAKQKALAPAIVVYKTLNGFDEKDAKEWIRNDSIAFVRHLPMDVVSYFLSDTMVIKLYNMLKTERATGVGHKADGFRIYFAKKTVTDQETFLLIVATKDSSGVACCNHHDYYMHNFTDLFDPTVTLPIRVDKKGADTGALLYNTSGVGDDPSCTSVSYPNAIKRSYAEQMVQKFTGTNMNSRAVWFPLDVLKLLVTETSFKGMRIYPATYPDNTYGYDQRNTFVLTTVDSAGQDYFNCYKNKDYFNKNVNKYYPLWGPPLNNGSLCPINCN
jgi:hypothetical protein